MSALGFEPRTNGLKGHCSTIELRARSMGEKHSNMVNIHRQRKMLTGKDIYVLEVLMAEMLHVTEETFKIEVLDSSEPVLVDFSAVWCQPCKMLDPIVKQLAGEWDGKVKVVKIDADENPNLVMQFGVMGIPTLLFFKSGEIKERITGFMPKEKLVARFAPHFG